MKPVITTRRDPAARAALDALVARVLRDHPMPAPAPSTPTPTPNTPTKG